MKTDEEMALEELRKALALRFHHVFSKKKDGDSLESVLSEVLDSMVPRGTEGSEVTAISVLVATDHAKLGMILTGPEVMLYYKGPQGTVELGQV